MDVTWIFVGLLEKIGLLRQKGKQAPILVIYFSGSLGTVSLSSVMISIMICLVIRYWFSLTVFFPVAILIFLFYIILIHQIICLHHFCCSPGCNYWKGVDMHVHTRGEGEETEEDVYQKLDFWGWISAVYYSFFIFLF